MAYFVYNSKVKEKCYLNFQNKIHFKLAVCLFLFSGDNNGITIGMVNPFTNRCRCIRFVYSRYIRWRK